MLNEILFNVTEDFLLCMIVKSRLHFQRSWQNLKLVVQAFVILLKAKKRSKIKNSACLVAFDGCY